MVRVFKMKSITVFWEIKELLFLILSDIILRVGGEMVHRGVEHDLIFSIETQT